MCILVSRKHFPIRYTHYHEEISQGTVGKHLSLLAPILIYTLSNTVKEDIQEWHTPLNTHTLCFMVYGDSPQA